MKARRILSFILVVAMILGVVPMGEIVAWAEGNQIKVTRVSVTKFVEDFNNKSEAYYSVLIYGENLEGVGIGVRAKTGSKQIVPGKQNPTIKNEFIVPASDDYESRIYITYNGFLKTSIDVELPDVNSIDPSSGIVDTSTKDTNEGITINVSGKTEDIIAKLYQGSNNIELETLESTNIIKSETIKDKSGAWSISFAKPEKEEKLEGGLSGDGKTKIEVEGQYTDLFSFRKKLDISDKINMFPTQGAKETEVTLKADKLLPNVSIFFLKTRDEIYTTKNMVLNESIRYTPKGGAEKEDTIKFKVPKTLEELGSYYVVLTNRIDDKSDIRTQINSYKIIEQPQFILVDGKSSVKLDSITPNKSSIRGIDARLKGMNIGRISKDIYSDPELVGEPNIENSEQMVIEYKNGKYNGKDVKSLTRNIQVFIGGVAKFRSGSDFTKDVFDYLEITVPENNDLERPVQDIFVEIKTKIIYDDETEAEIIETDTLKNGFTYTALDYIPEISNIVPDKIPVDNQNNVTKDFTISIIGKNFLKYRYVDDDGNIKFKMPKIDVLDQLYSDKWFDNENIKVYDNSGNELDGTEGKELGSRITVTIKEGSNIPIGILGNLVDLRLTNPLKISTEDDSGSHALGKISFVHVNSDKTPTITTVTPNTVTIDGETGVVIEGEKFYPGVKVYIEGVEVKNAKRNEIGNEITFDAPPGKEGFAQIIVQNEEGGADVYYPFTYVKTYTNPKIIDFNPKNGSANTLVSLSGQNLVLPNPLVSELEGIGIWKLIGTRVLLGEEEMNTYYIPDNEKVPGLQPYEGDNPIIYIDEDGILKLSDYYHSIILQEGPDENPVYYTISFDTKSGDIKLSDGDKEVYIIEIKGDKLIGEKDGRDYDLDVKGSSLEIKGKTLNSKTPYYVDEDNKIAGNRIKVINNNELVFNVKSMPRAGHYDLTIVNPDTKRDSKTGKDGFRYFVHPDVKPKIEKIDPNEGSIDGDYYINIIGNGFKYGLKEDDKASVIIGSVEVDPEDVEVDPDGKSIRVKVPKYPGDLENETDMDRKSVPVVVVNPDGGSDGIEDGFSYIIPISDPRIKYLILDSGSAAGGDSVIIEGSGFRYFEPYKDLSDDSIWDEGEPYTDLNDNGQWDDLRYWSEDKKVKENYKELAKNYDELVRPILPKVYFGNEQVEIIEFKATTIEVRTPKGIQGPVKVYVVNNDYGVSNKVEFNYKASTPKITNITPGTGRRQGRDKIEILGESFHESKIKVIENKTTNKEQSLQIIQIGNPDNVNVSNKSIPIDAPKNSGKIQNLESTVEVENLTVRYYEVEEEKKLDFTITEGTGDNKVEYKLEDVNYNGGEIFLPVNLLKDDENKPYKGYEYVRIMMEKISENSSIKRLRVDRGFSPNSKLRNSGHANVETPSYFAIGNVPLNLINPDGGKATTNFEYKNPDSNPTITNILREGEEGYPTDDGRIIVKVPYTGGNNIEIVGTDFRKSTDPNKKIKVTIGGIEVNTEIKYDPDEDISTGLYFEMPPMDQNLKGQDLRVVVENPDGGIATSEPIYIHITIPESEDLKITSVSPNFGPTVGGTLVTIHGEDFREPKESGEEELKVYFGRGKEEIRVPNEDILDIGPFKIVLRTPAYRAGLADIKVVNPDGNPAILPNAFNYVSDPKINSVVDPDNDKMVIQNISVEGGEQIKILGSDFMEGARVVFAPVLRELEKDEQSTGDIITVDTRRYVLESGVEGTEVERVNGQTILVTTPAGQLGDKGVIVINPDKGATNVYNIVYGIPEIAAPFDVEAEVVFDQFIRVNWSGVKDALEYEVYMSEDRGKFDYIGSTELTSFAVEKLRRNTSYQFLVRAIGQYGTSKPIDESKSNTVKTGRRIGPEDEDGELAEDTVINRNGSVADVIIGSRDFRSEGLTIDLTRGELAGVKDVNIRIPAKVISDTKGMISVLGQDYSMKFSPEVFRNSTIYDNRNNSGAGVVFSILTHNENIDLQGGQTIVGEKYLLKGNMYIDKSLSSMDYLNGGIDFRLDYDNLKARMRKLNNMTMVRYDSNTRDWVRADYVNRLGIYTIIGSRR